MYFGAADDTPPKVQRILPNGEIGLCFYRGNTTIYDGLGMVQSCVSGPLLRYQDIISEGRIDIAGVHLTTIGAHVLLSVPPSEIGSRTVRLCDLGDSGIRELESRIMSASGYGECFDAMDAYFLRRLFATDIDTLDMRRIQRALAYGQRHLAEAHIPELASEACLSPRHFSRIFTDMVGIVPKEYLRLRRFQSAMRGMKISAWSSASDISGDETCKERHMTLPPGTMTRIAWDNGYCDYAHLYSEFRKISGYSPRQLLSLSENTDDSYGWRM